MVGKKRKGAKNQEEREGEETTFRGRGEWSEIK